MTDYNHIKPGQILFIHELSASSPTSLRLTGWCVDVKILERKVRLEHRGAYVDVDVGLVPDEAFELGRLYQVIGEMHKPPMQDSPALLRARVARSVDGMDLDLYEQAVRIRRAFLESLQVN